MKRILFSFYFLFFLFLVQSQTKLNVLLNDGSKQEFDLLTSKLTFTDTDNLVVWNNNTISSTFQLGDIQKVLFSSSPNNIIPIQNDKLKCYYFDNRIYIKSNNMNEMLRASIVDIAGHQILTQSSLFNLSINVSSLKSGVYILVVNNQQLKFTK